jgi:hypothetical protein
MADTIDQGERVPDRSAAARWVAASANAALLRLHGVPRNVAIMQLVVASFPLMPHAPFPSMNTAHGDLDLFFPPDAFA